MTDDNKTSQEAVAEERCPLPPDLQNDLRAIGRLQGKNLCEINKQAVQYFPYISQNVEGMVLRYSTRYLEGHA